MNLVKKLFTLGVVSVLGLTSGVNATFFNPVDSGENSVELSGRLSFSDSYYSELAGQGDEVGIFRGSFCLGSSNVIDSEQSHYSNLKINKNTYDAMLDGGCSYNIKAYNFKTNTLWDAILMGYDEVGMHFRAVDNLGVVPEPSSFGLWGLCGLALRKRDKNK